MQNRLEDDLLGLKAFGKVGQLILHVYGHVPIFFNE